MMSLITGADVLDPPTTGSTPAPPRRRATIRSDPACLRSYTDVARWAAARGWLRLAFLRLDGRALAFDLALEHDGIHYVVKTGYDANHHEHGAHGG